MFSTSVPPFPPQHSPKARIRTLLKQPILNKKNKSIDSLIQKPIFIDPATKIEENRGIYKFLGGVSWKMCRCPQLHAHGIFWELHVPISGNYRFQGLLFNINISVNFQLFLWQQSNFIKRFPDLLCLIYL